MFAFDGFTPAYQILHLFDFTILDESDQEALGLNLRIRLLEQRRRASAYEELRNASGATRPIVQPEWQRATPEEAQEQVSLADLRREIRLAEFRTFRFYIRKCPVFAVGLEKGAIPLYSEILEHEVSYREENLGAARWTYLEPFHLTVDVARKLPVVEAFKALLSDQDSDHLLPKSYRRRAIDLIEREPAFRALLPLQGLFVAIENALIPDKAAVRRAYRLSGPNDLNVADEEQAGRPRGRPRKQEEAAIAYVERFPRGHAAFTWKEVLRILDVECGVLVSEDTLKQGLAALKNGEVKAENPV